MSFKVLIVESDHNLLHFYNTACENFHDDIEIIEASSGNQAIELFQNDDDFAPDLIICDYDVSDGQGLKLYQFLRHRYSDIPFIATSKDDGGAFTTNEQFNRSATNHYLEKPFNEQDFKDVLSVYLDPNVEQVDPEIVADEYQKINTIFFLRFQKTLCDIYIKLSDKKFIKLFHKDSGFNATDINKYISKKVKYLYVTNEDYEQFKGSIADVPFLEKIEQDAQLPEAENFDVTQAVLSALLQTYGLSETLLNKGFQNIKDTMSLIHDSKDVVELFKLRSGNHSFYSDHSLLVALLCTMALDHLDWKSQENIEKLCMAAILHDATLDEDVVNVMESGSLDQFDFITDEQKNDYFAHPHRIAELIRTKTELHEEVATIISEHHEKPDGSGFPRRLSYQNIHPLSALFIVIHDFVEQLYLTQFNINSLPTIFVNMNDKYYNGHFQSAYMAFLKLFSGSKISKSEAEALVS